jgi:hypothetical protein
MDAHRLDLGSQSTASRQSRDERHLQSPDDSPSRVGHSHQQLRRVGVDDSEGPLVGRQIAAVARGSDLIGGDQIDDRSDVIGHGSPDVVGLAAGGDLREDVQRSTAR